MRSSLALVCLLAASAHRPLLTKPSCDGDFSTSDTAANVPDPTISWATQHYADCTSRALWFSFVNPFADFLFYVGVGVPVQERFADLRADALIIGPGLPNLTPEELSYLPKEIRDDPAMMKGNGGILHKAPADQSTCAHLGKTMTEASSIKNGRCDFFETYGQTNTWRVLDADGNAIPDAGAKYHVAVWLQTHTSGKFGVAMGTWKEDFVTRFDMVTPSCERNIQDFSEQKVAIDAKCFPVVQCPGMFSQ